MLVVVIQCLWMFLSCGLTEKLDRGRQKLCLLWLVLIQQDESLFVSSSSARTNTSASSLSSRQRGVGGSIPGGRPPTTGA